MIRAEAARIQQREFAGEVPGSFEQLKAAIRFGQTLPLEPTVALWGSTGLGSQGAKWQLAKKQALVEAGVKENQIFDPEKAPGVAYTHADTIVEGVKLRRSAAHFTHVTTNKLALQSNLEAGIGALRSLLTGTAARYSLSPLRGDEVISEDAVRARKLAILSLGRVHTRLQELGFKNISIDTDLTSGDDDEAWLRGIAQRLRLDNFGNPVSPLRIPEPALHRAREKMLKRRVFLSGTSAPRERMAAKDSFMETLEAAGVEVVDSYIDTDLFGSREIEAELDEREQSLVHAHIITNDTLSIGAVTEVGWLMTSALLNGQRFGTYIEEPDEAKLREAALKAHQKDPATDVEKTVKDALRVRRALKLHLENLHQDFPYPIATFSSPEKLAAWARRASQKKGHERTGDSTGLREELGGQVRELRTRGESLTSAIAGLDAALKYQQDLLQHEGGNGAVQEITRLERRRTELSDEYRFVEVHGNGLEAELLELDTPPIFEVPSTFPAGSTMGEIAWLTTAQILRKQRRELLEEQAELELLDADQLTGALLERKRVVESNLADVNRRLLPLLRARQQPPETPTVVQFPPRVSHAPVSSGGYVTDLMAAKAVSLYEPRIVPPDTDHMHLAPPGVTRAAALNPAEAAARRAKERKANADEKRRRGANTRKFRNAIGAMLAVGAAAAAVEIAVKDSRSDAPIAGTAIPEQPAQAASRPASQVLALAASLEPVMPAAEVTASVTRLLPPGVTMRRSGGRVYGEIQVPHRKTAE